MVKGSAQPAPGQVGNEGPEELESCLFTETLEVVAAEDQPGVQITGQWWAAVRWAPYKPEGKPARSCLLVQAGFRIRQDNVPCSSTFKAYVTPLLETLEQEEQERLEVTAHPVERRTHIVNHHHGMTVTKTVQEGEAEPKSWSFYYLQEDLRGVLPEGASILLLRVLAHLQAVPPDLIFPAFNTEGQLCISSYRAVGFQQQAVGSARAEVLVIERSMQASADTSTVWHSSFLPSGRLVRRVQMGSPMLVLLQNESVLGETGEVKPQPLFPKQPLDWEEDIQLYSWFLDRKEELQASHSDYLQRHPEYWAVQYDFLQALLLRQPCDLLSFADEFFAPFSHQRPPETRFPCVKAVRPSPPPPPPSPFSV
ncbi:PREDICTED: ciliogenesis-associated TTC17-interacting protein [Chaetura pelagica]|uniref:ciliogenesis-associated TTC17-interacting protein n=1 Tax=Chaetura pelagica TaxID=8897 RepID=UPI000523A3E9|nr:PREDICTED: ciliogenesis-associated TTC17-interacting protein [Chaetura pelagica]